MIDAPTFGKPVGIHPIRYQGDDFAGGGRVKAAVFVVRAAQE
jgi:hypothetical protein